jgi:hypothetical protein
MLAKDDGTLFPANDHTPEHWCNSHAGDAFKIYLGQDLAYIQDVEGVNAFPSTVLRIAGEDMLTIDKDKGNLIIRLLRVFDDRNDLIAKIDSNDWKVKSFKKTPDLSTFIVYDHLDHEVLNLRFANKSTLIITGVQRHPGYKTITVSRDAGLETDKLKNPRGNCTGYHSNKGAAFAFN